MNRPPDIEGQFHLLDPKHCGPGAPLYSGCRPIHKLHDNYLTSGTHEYREATQVAPGETAKVAVWFITPDVYPKSLWVGREIDVMAGSKIIGKLTVTRILNEVLSGNPETYSPIWVEPPNLDANGKSTDT